MKKIIILLITTILLTGCQTTYDINFTNNNIQDVITIQTESTKVNNATSNQIEEFQQKLGDWERGYEFYKRELFTEENKTGYKYTYNFKYEEYDAMSQLRKCYDDFELTYNNKIITLKTSNEFLCQSYYKDIDNITINIKSDYQIIDSNADKKKNNTHTWNINKNNYQNKPIEFTINKLRKNNKEIKNNIFDIKSIIIIILFIFLIIIYKKRKRQLHK